MIRNFQNKALLPSLYLVAYRPESQRWHSSDVTKHHDGKALAPILPGLPPREPLLVLSSRWSVDQRRHRHLAGSSSSAIRKYKES